MEDEQHIDDDGNEHDDNERDDGHDERDGNDHDFNEHDDIERDGAWPPWGGADLRPNTSSRMVASDRRSAPSRWRAASRRPAEDPMHSDLTYSNPMYSDLIQGDLI